MLLQLITFILFFLVFIVFAIDAVPIVINWMERIKIGKYQNRSSWNENLIKKASSWLINIPTVKVTDNSRLIIIDMIKGNYSKNTIQHWQEASLLLGLAEYIKSKDDSKVKAQVKKYLQNNFDADGQWIHKPQHIDVAILAYSIMKLNFIETDKYKKALDYTWQLIQEHIGEDGTVGYRKSMEDYRYVDTIGFICPFLIAYGLKYEKNECIELAVKQIKEYEQHAMLNNHYIPSHAYKIDSKAPIGLYGWGRGLGWYAIGLIDSWSELPESNSYKATLEESVRRFAKSSMDFQQANGSWNWTVTRNETRADSSATATLAWFLLNASKISDISEECLVSTDKAINYLMSVTRRKGAVDFSQGDTKDIGVYSMLFGILPFTQGFSIRLINFEGLEKKVT